MSQSRQLPRSTHSPTCAALLAVLASALFAAVASAGTGTTDGIQLDVAHSAAPGNLELSWAGGVQPYLVFGSSDPAAVVTGSTRIATTGGSTIDVPVGAAAIDFFLVVNVDTTSAVTATSNCLTAGTGAQAAVVVELRDSLGNPLEGAAVVVSADAGSVGPVVETGGTYRAVLAAPLAGPGPATVSVTAEGLALSAQPSLSIEDPLVDATGAGGCPADGNLRVRVLDEDGMPLAGANVMVGQAEQLDRFATTPGAPPDGANTAISNPDGFAEFVDFDDALDGPQTVTAAAADRRYVTLIDVNAADTVLVLAPVDASEPGEVFTGDITNVPAPANDPIEMAFMLPDVSIDQILAFSASDLLSDNNCYDAGGIAGQLPVPGNVYFPSQCAVQILFCLQSLPEHVYTSAAIGFGERKLLALRANAPLDVLTSGDFGQVLSELTLDGIGVVDQTVSTAGTTPLDIPISDTIAANVSCSIDNPPANSDVFCLAAGDWDSGFDPLLPVGAGRLFLSGFRLGDAAGATLPLTISGLTTMTATGDFAGIDYLGASVAQYNDPAKPGIPPGTVGGSSTILDRSGTAFDGSGGTLTFDDYIPIRTLARAGRDFSLGSLPGSGHPTPHLTRVLLDRVVNETYTACLADDSARVIRSTLWEIVLPGATEAWQLPVPPVGWPRQDVGGDLAGLIDPAVTPEDDSLSHSAATVHLGSLPGFDYDQLHFEDLPLHLTHVTRNEVAY